jgi:ParB family transcriptional regulator, chromosome partitioning protein
MSQKKPTLGRGLADLLGQARAPSPAAPAMGAPETAASAAALRGDALAKLPVELLQRGRYQPRSDLRNDTLDELAESIKAQGVIQPIVVRPLAPGSDGAGGGAAGGGEQRYEIIAGERRWRAAQLAGLTEVPAIIRNVPDEAAVAMALIENIQREDLNPIEEAAGLERLIAEFKLTHEEAATAVGRSRSAVTNLLRLLELAKPVQEMVLEGKIDMGHARALLALAKARQVELAGRIAAQGLSVREAERLAQQAHSAPKAGRPPAARLDTDTRRLQEELSESVGATVAIKARRGGRGSVVIGYGSLEQLEGIVQRLKRK